MGGVPYFQVLCLAGVAHSLQSVNHQSISAIGKSKVMFNWTFVKRLAGILMVVMGLIFGGMKGLLVGMVLNTWFSYFVNIGLVSKHIGYKWYNQLKDLTPNIIASIVAALTSYMVTCFLDLSLYIDGMTKLIVFLSIYMGWSFTFNPESYCYLNSIIIPLIQKVKYRIVKPNKGLK